MTDTIKASFERCCRLCAEEQDVTIMIFSQEAEEMLLQNKLNKYLLIEVDEDDKLPKNICIHCCSKLQTVCDFIDTARKAQDLLLNRSLMLDDVIPGDCVTKIKHEFDASQDSLNNDRKYTEMEVSVDPMMVLQNSEGTLSPNNDDDYSMEDVTYLHADAVDIENVTIKLIKKNEPRVIPPESEDEDLSDSPKPFSCITCKRSFLTELALKNHAWQHMTEDDTSEKYTCSTCLTSFQYKHELVGHLKQHRTNGLCQLCGRMFRSEKTYMAHMSVHLPLNESYTCKTCGRSYNTWGGLKTHSIAHSSERPYLCQFCKKTFKRKQDLKFHINQHTGAKPYKCPFCEKSFASSGNCYSHRSRMHPGKRVEGRIRKWDAPAREPASPRPIPSKSPPVRPITPTTPPRPDTPSTSPRPDTPKSSPRPVSPQSSSRPNTPKSPSRPITPKSSSRPNTPQTSPRPITPKSSPQTKTPKSNLTVVKGLHKYQCQQCNASFGRRDNLTYHMYQHTGEKPFQCSFCPGKFVTRRGLIFHHDKEHPGKDRPLALISKNILLK